MIDENQISSEIVSAAIEVHRTLGGPGLLESVYEKALAWEPCERGLSVERQKTMPIVCKGRELATPLSLGLVINNLVIIECKATTEFNEIFKAQTLTYLRLTGLKLALIINFGESLVKKGIYRIVNHL